MSLALSCFFSFTRILGRIQLAFLVSPLLAQTGDGRCFLIGAPAESHKYPSARPAIVLQPAEVSGSGGILMHEHDVYLPHIPKTFVANTFLYDDSQS